MTVIKHLYNDYLKIRLVTLVIFAVTMLGCGLISNEDASQAIAEGRESQSLATEEAAPLEKAQPGPPKNEKAEKIVPPIRNHIINKLKPLSPTAYSEIEKKERPLPAAIPIAKAKTKYIDIAIKAICQTSIILIFFLIYFYKN